MPAAKGSAISTRTSILTSCAPAAPSLAAVAGGTHFNIGAPASAFRARQGQRRDDDRAVIAQYTDNITMSEPEEEQLTKASSYEDKLALKGMTLGVNSVGKADQLVRSAKQAGEARSGPRHDHLRARLRRVPPRLRRAHRRLVVPRQPARRRWAKARIR
jgi:hypothetical protein